MSKMRKTIAFVTSMFLIVASLLIGCGTTTNTANQNTKKEIIIGAVGAMTGPTAQLGANLRQGVDLAVEQINASGGINGRMIRVVYRDDEADPTKSRNAVEELITKEKAIAIIGPTNTTCGLSAQPVISQYKIPQMDGGMTGTELIDVKKYPYSFRTILNNSFQAQGMVKYVVKRGWKRVAIVHDTSALGVGGAKDLKNFLGKVGITPVADVTYTVNDQDMTSQANALKVAKPDVALFWTLGVDGARIMKALEKIDYLPPKINILGYTAVTMKNFTDLAGPAAKDVLGVSASNFAFSSSKPLSDQTKKFLDALDKKYGTNRDTIASTVGTHYDAVYMLADAMKKVGTDGDKIKKELESITNYKGVSDVYSFTPDKHEGPGPESVQIVQIAKQERSAFGVAPN